MKILDWREKVNWLRALPLYVAGSAVILLPPATEATESFTGSRGPEENALPGESRTEEQVKEICTPDKASLSN
jgi:hypothetical protein